MAAMHSSTAKDFEEGSSWPICLRCSDSRRFSRVRAGTARPTGERSQMTVAGVVSVVLIAVAAALVIYLLVALVDPERF